MNHKKWAVFNLTFFLLLASLSASGQSPAVPSNDWEELQQIPIGQKIAVEEKTGKKRNGKAHVITDAILEIERKGKIYSYRPDEIKNVWRVIPPSRKKRTLAIMGGAAAGFFAGAGMAYAVAAGCEDACGGGALVGAMLLFFGTPVASGFIANALVGDGKHELVYSAP